MKMKRIGTIKFYRDWENIQKHSNPYFFKESLLLIILDYLSHYKLDEIDNAMENIRKYFYPELFRIYLSIVDYYPKIITIFRHLSISIDNHLTINSYSSPNIISVNENIYDSLVDQDEKNLTKLIIANINSRKSIEDFRDSIILYNNKLDIFANIIARTVIAFIGRYQYLSRAVSSGIKYYQYVDSNLKCRKFCEGKDKKHFHIDEILKMNNNEFGPVLFFCGGLGCNHTFEADPFYKKRYNRRC